MGTVTFNNKSYSLDEHGFLDPPDQWDENFARGMANSLGIASGLNERHWQVINYLRHKFLVEKTVPVIVTACSQNGMRLRELKSLFPTGYHRGACRIAGINYKFMYETNYWLTYETGPPMRARYPLDQLGFLKDYRKWDEDFVPFIIAEMKMAVKMTDDHWPIIQYLRDYFEKNGNIPTIYELCAANLISLCEINEMFPSGYRRGACRLAGLPFYT